MSPITSHVLDTSLGKPADGIVVALSVLEPDDVWKLVTQRRTSADGRVVDLLPEGALEARTYRLRFDTAGYFASSGRASFYPYVDVVFSVSAASEHHHVPLLLSPYGYSTYRGS
jgi:5-hydroxyisourate hydrolase